MNTKEEHRHQWRAYGQPDGTVVCDDCNVGTDVNALIKSRESALLSRIADIIGEDENMNPDWIEYTTAFVDGQNSLRAEQRTKLDQLSKELE